ncbi:hypothetical protein GIB67_028167 [Kingdonia uniflora]|uniref:Uncharacterized protein n=1 Tax=Kingdonia uniflora TaxID=39325 RepID=A0A7J7KZT8_9MAGN|nr:hypothetical protein GIB67_028167 [Kingdonia uniflora]
MCNRKLIGANYFNKGVLAQDPNISFVYNSPRDETGIGTHTTSIAVGNYVRGVSYFGYAKGTTKGTAPCARLAIYKVIWSRGGSLTYDVIASMDQTLADGVDIISMSISFRGALPYEDSISITSFAALEKGTLTLGNGKTIIGWSLFPGRALLNASLVYNETLTRCNSPALLSEYANNAIVNYRGVLKLDVVAPGSQVLAAWSLKVTTGRVGSNNLFLSSNYNILFGTSMTCLHASGVVVLLKGAHADWSPGAIRSAMMTTANPLDNTNIPILDVKFSRPATGLDMGVDQIDPNKALNPGLIYDAGVQDYVSYIYSLNFTREHETSPTAQEFKMTVTNMGDGSFTYSGKLTQPSGAIVSVSPNKLVFQKKFETLSFVVNIMDTLQRNDKISSGVLVWIDTNGKHRVRSPIVVIDPLSGNT